MSITANVVGRLCPCLFHSPHLRFPLEILSVDDIFISFRIPTLYAQALLFCFLFFSGCHHLTHEAIEHRLFSLTRKSENYFFIQIFFSLSNFRYYQMDDNTMIRQ